MPLRLYWENQQDAIRHTWSGHVAGTDGSVKWQEQRMGAGFAIGRDSTPAAMLSVRVGWPLSSLRAEAAALYMLLASHMTTLAPLVVFVDNLIAYTATLGTYCICCNNGDIYCNAGPRTN
jgi:hypothetical protein